jgi:hypothetical protein
MFTLDKLFSHAATLSLLYVFAGSAVAQQHVDQQGVPHRKQQDDPPLPPPAQPPISPVPLGGPVMGVQSVQVNVDAQGNNVFGDAANEPSMAIDPTDPDRIVIGWRQFDNVASNFRQAGRGYSTDAGASWTFPGVLTPGTFRSDPVLSANSEGAIYYYSLGNPNTFACDMFISADAGVTWTDPIPAFGGDKAWMTIDRTGGIGDGNIYVAWSTITGSDTFTRSTDGGLTYMEPIELPGTPVFGTIDVGPDGAVYVAGINNPSFNNSNFRLTQSTDAQNPALAPTFSPAVSVAMGGALRGGAGPNPGGLLGQVWVAVDRSGGPTDGNVYLLSSVNPPGPDPLDVMFVRSTDGGASFSAPLRVNDDLSGTNAWQWFGTMSVAPNGRIDAVWNDTRSDPAGAFSETRYSYSTDTGVTWAPSIPLTPSWNSLIGWPNQSKIGDYYHMISDEQGASLAFAATFNGEQDVYFRRILPGDCNANGVADAAEIAMGVSPDCNANGVPDACDLDCNGNAIPDACDIAGGTAADINGNGIPDSCEVFIVAADPPKDNPYLPGQQPFRDVLDTGPTSMLTRGIGGAGTPPAGSVNYSPIRVTFSGPILPAPAPVNVRLSCTYTSLGPSGMTECPTVTNIVSVGANTFEFHLTSPIPPGGCTTLTVHATQRVERLRYEFMPGDVTMDGTANTQDLLALVQAMRNGVANLPANLPRYNINRSTGPGEPVNTQDLLRLVQLLNGINTTQVWNGAALVPCP